MLVTENEDRPVDHLLTLFYKMNDDEREVLLEVASRIVRGREKYGPMVIMLEKDWQREADEEGFDQAVYLAIDALRRRKMKALAEG